MKENARMRQVHDARQPGRRARPEGLRQKDLRQGHLGGPTMRGASILLAAGVAVLLPAALLPAALGPAAAETYPARPITLVVPFAPGGSASTVARSVADKMSETLGEQIVIDNRRRRWRNDRDAHGLEGRAR